LQVDHPTRQAAVPADPVPHGDRIDIPQSLRSHRAGDGAAVGVRHPGGVEAEARAWRRADMVARDQSEHQRAGRQAIAVDHHLLAARTQRGEVLQVLADLAAAIFGDAHGGRRRRNAGRQQGGAEQQAPNTHDRPHYSHLFRRLFDLTASLSQGHGNWKDLLNQESGDSSKIKLSMNLSAKYEKKGAVTIPRTYRIRLYVSNTAGSNNDKLTQPDEAKIKSLDAAFKTFLSALETNNFENANQI